MVQKHSELVNEIDGCIKAGISSIPRRGVYSIFITIAKVLEIRQTGEKSIRKSTRAKTRVLSTYSAHG